MEKSSESDEINVPDAFGIALEEYYNEEGPGTYRTERDDGYVSGADLTHYFDGYDEWEEPTRQALAYVREGDVVLDVGCGSGRHALWLQQQGNEVVGIDQSQRAIDICRDLGLESAEVMDMTDLDFDDDQFDTVVVIGTIIGLGNSLADVRGHFAEFDRITTDNGRVIMDSQKPFPEGVDDTEYFRQNQIDDRNAATVRFRVRYEQYVENWLEMTLFGPDELRKVVADTPWSVTETIEMEPGEGWYSVGMQWYFAILDK